MASAMCTCEGTIPFFVDVVIDAYRFAAFGLKMFPPLARFLTWLAPADAGAGAGAPAK